MDKYFLSRRAGLDSFLEKRKGNFDACLKENENLIDTILRNASLSNIQQALFLDSMLVSLCSGIESFVMDTAIEIGNCFPQSVLKKDSAFVGC